MRVLVTGAAGFIGMHTAERLLERGDEVVGVDDFNDYYDVRLKRDRVARLRKFGSFRLAELDVSDAAGLADLFARERPQRVVHLAAQAGVRYSIENPRAYVASNLVGFANVLEGCRNGSVEHLVYASSSSVYGANTAMPFSTSDTVDHPVSLYAATKKANEVMAHSYSHVFGLPTTGLRFFTVFGPWGRPDMAMFKFTRAILRGEPIDLYNYGAMRRDFTYVSDVVEGVVRVLGRIAEPDETWDGANPNAATSRAPYRVFNIGNDAPIELAHLVQTIERFVGRSAVWRLLPMQPGDVPETRASVEDLERWVGYRPSTPFEVGVRRFLDWYVAYYGATLTDASATPDPGWGRANAAMGGEPVPAALGR